MSLGELEEKILLAILLLGNDTYGAQVREELAKAGRKVSVGALYTTIERLEAKRLIDGREGEVTTSLGGKARRFFAVTAIGKAALEENEAVRTNLRPPLLAGGTA